MLPDELLKGPQVWRRYNVSAMTGWRWLQDAKLGFPTPIRIRGRNYWRLRDLEAWERHAAAQNTS